MIGRPRIEPEQQGHHRVAERALALGLERQGRGRIGDDARQAGRIQHAFLQIEHPAAVLLRQQAALQLVGEAGDHAGQLGQLLVQQGAQAVQLDRVAQLLGGDDLVKGGGEGAIDGGVIAAFALGAAGAHALFGVGGLIRLLPVGLGRSAVRTAVALAFRAGVLAAALG